MINLLEKSQQIIVIPKNTSFAINKIKLHSQARNENIELEVEDKTDYNNYYTVIVDTTDIVNGEWEAQYLNNEDILGYDLWNVGYNSITNDEYNNEEQYKEYNG